MNDAPPTNDPLKDKPAFDFESHKKTAVQQYSRKRKLYEEFAWEIENILTEAIETEKLKINEIQCRAKTEDSFGKKAATPSPNNPGEPKYKEPMTDITDLAGVRVITFFPSTVTKICELIVQEFQ